MRILIVDDSRAMRMIIKRTLRHAGFGHHRVEEATNGKEAYDAIELDPPDLVLTDWRMPEMSGIELLEALRDDGKDIRLGFVTSRGTREAEQRAAAAGAMFLITKPFSADAFKHHLQPVLSRR